MRITQLEPQKRHKNRYNLYLDGEFALGLTEDVVYQYGLKENKEIDESFLESVLKKEEQMKANDYALNLLGFSARSEHQIRQKMKDKGFEPESIEGTVQFLRNYNYLNDEEYARSFVKDRQAFKKAGKRLLQQELRQKGVHPTTIESVLAEAVSTEDELTRAQALVQQKIKVPNPDKKEIQRVTNFLARKGYSWDIISRALKTYTNDEWGES